jgi:hypothetical protein
VRGLRDDGRAKVADAPERIRRSKGKSRSQEQARERQGTDLGGGHRYRGVKVLAAQVDGADAGAPQRGGDQLRQVKSAVIAGVGDATQDHAGRGRQQDRPRVESGELVGNVARSAARAGAVRFRAGGWHNPAAPSAALQSASVRAAQTRRERVRQNDRLKYGGILVGLVDLIQRVAEKVAANCVHRIAVVVSAMGIRRIARRSRAGNREPAAREMDVCCPRANRCRRTVSHGAV